MMLKLEIEIPRATCQVPLILVHNTTVFVYLETNFEVGIWREVPEEKVNNGGG